MGKLPLFFICIRIGNNEKSVKVGAFNVYGLIRIRLADDTVRLCGNGPVSAGYRSIARPVH
jgi:hypothetical protein